MQLKTTLIAMGLACSTTAMAAGNPFSGFDGFISAAVGGTDHDGSVNEMRNNYAYGASLAYTDQSGFGGQLDYLHSQHGWNNGVLSDSPNESSSSDLVGHLSYRTGDWLLGGFVNDRRFYTTGNYYDTQRFVGAEAKLFLKDMTLYGQAGRNEWRDLDEDGPFAALQLNYYLSDNFRLSAGIAQVQSENSTGTYKYEQTNFDLGAEYRFENSPFSGFVSYNHIRETDNGSWKVNTGTVLLGVKFNFGKDSLRKSDREGATLAPAPRVIQFGGWT